MKIHLSHLLRSFTNILHNPVYNFGFKFVFQIKLSDLSDNHVFDIGAHYLSKCIHKIEKLQLKKCRIEEEGVNALAEQIKKREKPVIKHFSFNPDKTNFSGTKFYDGSV